MHIRVCYLWTINVAAIFFPSIWCSTICHDNQHRSSAIAGDSHAESKLHAWIPEHKSATFDTILKLVECLWST